VTRRPRPALPRRLAQLALICLGLLAVASPAESAPAVAGAGQRSEHASGSPIVTSGRVRYLGGPVLHSTRVHLLFWQPAGAGLNFDAGYVELFDQFMQGVAADSHLITNEFSITGQYRDASGPAAYAITMAPSQVISDAVPSSGCTEPPATGPGWSYCLTDAQIQQELDHVVSSERLPHGNHDAYVLVTPSGLGDCQDGTSSACALGGGSAGYCGYHSWTSSGILYAVVPYNAIPGHCLSGNPRPNSSAADPALSTLMHELVETITDPEGNAWITAAGNEIADLCLSEFGRALGGSGGTQWNETIDHRHYWLQEIYSRLAGRCEPRPRPDQVTVAGPRELAAGAPGSFEAHARAQGGSVQSYGWSFGDGGVTGGATVSRSYARGGATVTHTYAHAGRYQLTLRITDGAGNWAFATATIRVTPPRPGAASARAR
jgi:hypothetical protein